jgi:hypothetical protein
VPPLSSISVFVSRVTVSLLSPILSPLLSRISPKMSKQRLWYQVYAKQYKHGFSSQEENCMLRTRKISSQDEIISFDIKGVENTVSNSLYLLFYILSQMTRRYYVI